MSFLKNVNFSEFAVSVTYKVIIEKYRSEVSLMEQDTIENVS